MKKSKESMKKSIIYSVILNIIFILFFLILLFNKKGGWGDIDLFIDSLVIYPILVLLISFKFESIMDKIIFSYLSSLSILVISFYQLTLYLSIFESIIAIIVPLVIGLISYGIELIINLFKKKEEIVNKELTRINTNLGLWIVLNNVIFAIISIFIMNLGDLDNSILFTGIYVLYVLISTIFVTKIISKRTIYSYLSLAILLIFSLYDFINEIIIGKIPNLQITYPEFLVSFYFYLFFPAIFVYLITIIEKILSRNKISNKVNVKTKPKKNDKKKK